MACEIPVSGLGKTTRFYQSINFDCKVLVQQTPQTEETPFHPRRPLVPLAKNVRHWMHGKLPWRPMACMPATASCLTHESPRRGEPLFTRKKSRAGLANIAQGWRMPVYGNIRTRCAIGPRQRTMCANAKWMMLQQERGKKDFVSLRACSIPCASSINVVCGGTGESSCVRSARAVKECGLVDSVRGDDGPAVSPAMW